MVTPTLTQLFYMLLLTAWNPIAEGTGDDNVMGCALCTIVAEAMMVGETPAGALEHAYRRCGKMGLMEPVCDQMVERNAKKLIEMANDANTAPEICAILQLCVG